MEETRTATRLGAVVRRRRLELGLTQGEVAERAGVSPKSVVTLEMGRSGGIRFDKLRAVLDALGLSLFVGERPPRDERGYDELYASLVEETMRRG